jgi:hypothetical protein
MLSDIFADWIPVVATGKAVFMIVLDTPIETLALARIGNDLNVGLAPPGAEIHTPDAGHFALCEKPEEIAELIANFQGRTLVRPAELE